MPNKICTKCKEEKPLDCFHRNKRKPLGKESRCKNCINNDPRKKERGKRYYEENKEALRDQKKIYYATNKEKIALRDKIYAAKNKDKISARQKAYREKHREELNAYTKKWREDNRDYEKSPKRREYKRQYHASGHRQKYDKEYTYKYYHSPRGRFKGYKAQAKIRNYDFDLTFEQFNSFWQKPCTYCGSHIEEIGLDRVDNHQGYHMKNVVACCFTCNQRKKAMSYVAWNEWTDRLIKRYDIIKKELLND